MNILLKEKTLFIQNLIQKMENKTNNKNTTIVDILKEEIKKLKELNNEYQSLLNSKKIIHTEKKNNKTRYYLTDGSTYVVCNRYKYLYDSRSKTITYEFDNKQIERTFPCGLKEIRYPDGSIVIKDGNKDYECIKKAFNPKFKIIEKILYSELQKKYYTEALFRDSIKRNQK